MSNFGYKTGLDANGNSVITNIPVKYAETNRQASFILRNNSPASLLTAPSIACYVTGLTFDRERMQEPNFISKVNIRERQFDDNTNQYTSNSGQGYTVERHMPVPFDLQITADLWTTNTEQKLQILEQILVLFNPSLEIQTNSNFIDWTSLSVVNLNDITFSSRPIPMGTEDQYDIATMTFTIPIWLSPPVKVKKLGVIQTIIANMYDESGKISDEIINGTFMERQYITPTNFSLLLLDGVATLLSESDTIDNKNDSVSVPNKIGPNLSWNRLLELYGELRDNTSQIRLTLENGNDIIGTVARDPNDENKLLFSVDPDTIPTNTLTAINAIINPLTKAPGHGLPNAALGQRYLLVDDIGNANNTQPAIAWGNLIAYANDIVEFDGTNWIVSFNSQNHSAEEYLTNAFTNIQYKWTGTQWVKSYEGEWPAGVWTVVL